MEEWGYECNLKLDFFATQGGRNPKLLEKSSEFFKTA
jgi:hypothetical protein